MQWQWQSIVFWVGAILIIVLATIVYQPAAAKTGSLLVWTRNHVYLMDIDTLDLQRVGPADPDELMTPSPGCFSLLEVPCQILVGERLYQIDLNGDEGSVTERTLPLEPGTRLGEAVSWSPDGLHLAYMIVQGDAGAAELRLYETLTGEIKFRQPEVDPAVAPAWTAGCAEGLAAEGCELGYKKSAARLVGLKPATGEIREWTISPEPIFELRWSPAGVLLYSRPKRHFINPETNAPAYHLPPGARLANLSPDAAYAVYYQPFTLTDCQAEEEECLHLGVWVARTGDADVRPELIYSLNLAEDQLGGLSFIPTWTPLGEAFVFIQSGRLIYYNLANQEAAVWYKPLAGKLRSVPVFSPDKEAVAFVDNQGQGYSEYRLVIVNPKLQPIEHVIETKEGFRVLAWLPN
jgi:hypothetical protein